MPGTGGRHYGQRPTMEDLSWQDRAECRQHDPETWFPVADVGAEYARAKKICKSECKVRLECLAYAVRTQQRYGVWGGTSAEERHQLFGNVFSLARVS